MQIVNWRAHLKFPEEAKLSPEAKDLISKLLCDVTKRLGSNGAAEIKVFYGVYYVIYVFLDQFQLLRLPVLLHYRLILGLMELTGREYTTWKLLSYLKSMMSWTLKTLKSLRRY